MSGLWFLPLPFIFYMPFCYKILNIIDYPNDFIFFDVQ